MSRLDPVRKLLPHRVLRHPGIRARLYLALMVAVAATAPVVIQSLVYMGHLGEAVERLDAQGARTHELLVQLGREARQGEVENLRRAVAEIDARLTGMEAARAEASEILKNSRRNVITVLILTVAVLALLVWLLPRRVVAPLRRILNVVRRATQGDYAAQARLEAPDELGAMAREVNRLLKRVEEESEGKDQLIRAVRRDMDLFGRSVPQALCLVDPDRRILWTNEAFEALVGAEDDLTTRCVTDHVKGPQFTERLHEAFVGGSEEGEVEVELPGGERVRRWLYTAAGLDPEGSVDRVAVVLAEGPRSEPSRAGQHHRREA